LRPGQLTAILAQVVGLIHIGGYCCYQGTFHLSKFAFIIHPLDISDVARKYKFTTVLPKAVVEWMLHYIPVKTVSHITGIQSPTGAHTEGWFIGCPLTADQLKNGDPDKCTRKIIQAGRIAEELGADIVGLGAFTSIVGDAGHTVARELNIGVTTGNSYTVATALEGALTAVRMLGRDPAHCTATILGATGSVGRVAAKMLSPQVARTVLNARSAGPVEELAAQLGADGNDAHAETDIDAALREADIVIAVTSAVEAVVHPAMLKAGAVVCDVARPRDVSRRVAQQRQDVLVIEGGAVRVPGQVDFGFNFGFPPGESYACMAETMILALEGKCEDYSLGRDIHIEQVQEIAQLADKHGFELAGFRSFERKVTEEGIARVREAAQAADRP